MKKKVERLNDKLIHQRTCWSIFILQMCAITVLLLIITGSFIIYVVRI